MINNRLELSKELLNDKGSMFMSIDDKEQARLKLVCDEVFGEENFVNEIVWCRTSSSAKKAQGNEDEISSSFVKAHDTIFLYTKNPAENYIRKNSSTTIQYSDRVLKSLETDEFGNVSYKRGKGTMGGKAINEKVEVDIEKGMLARSWWADIPIMRHNSQP